MSKTIQEEWQAIAMKTANQVPTPDSATTVLDTNGNPVPVAPANVTPETEPVTPAVAPVTPAPVVPAAQSGLIEDWAVEPTPVVPTTPITSTQPDFTELAKALGKEKISGVEEVVQEFQMLKSTVDSYKTAPEDLVKAMEIAQKGGDYLEYLKVSSVDWSKEDPTDIYITYIEDQYVDPKTGLVDYEKADKMLERLSDEEKEFKGRELQRAYVNHQKQQQAYIEQVAIAKKAQFESSVKDIVNTINDINGFVLTPAKKNELMQYVLNGEDLRHNDLRQRIVNAFITKNFNAIDSYLKTKVKNTTTREILQEAQVPDLKSTPEKVEVQTGKGYSVNDWIKDLQKSKGF